MADVKKIADQLVELTVKEVNELLEVLKTEHGIEPAAAAVAVAVCCVVQRAGSDAVDPDAHGREGLGQRFGEHDDRGL